MAARFVRRQPDMNPTSPFGSAAPPARLLGTPGAAIIIMVVHLAATTLGVRSRYAAAPAVEQRTLRLDANTALRADLMLLPGIGPALADRIIEYRNSLPPPAFRGPEDLDRVHRIGPATIEKLAPHLRFDSAAASPARGPR